MKILKPTWVNHDGLPIFSIDVHPDKRRFVTGGQGINSVGRIAIWNMEPLLDKEKSENENIPKLLCELENQACVNAVRWSHNGKYLSTGGDDKVIEIWKCASKLYNGSAVTPSTNAFLNASHEQWRSVVTLNGHKGDILDVAWQSSDKYLASASVDNTVIIWDAINFPQIITTLKGHTSMVKGVTWDPVGKFIATQSDDKTLRIWRTSDWQLEQIVREPFHECGGTTHVLRLDWSPDGSYLVSAHAMNAGGPTAQIVERTGWKTDKDFVGHRKAVVCVRYNPNILQRNKAKSCCVALGSRDRSVSVWSAALKRPVVVINDVFTSSVMDLSWSSCGTILLCCSFDGTVSAVQFTWGEIGKPIPNKEVVAFLEHHYGINSLNSSRGCVIAQDINLCKANKNTTSGSSSSNKKVAAVAENPNSSSTVVVHNNTNNNDHSKQTNGIVISTETTKTTNSATTTTTPLPSSSSSNNISSGGGHQNNINSTHVTDSINTTPTTEKKSDAPTEVIDVEPPASSSSILPPPELMDTNTKSSSPVNGPLYKQIETVRNGKRRITPQFLLPQNSQNSLDESNLGNRIENDSASTVASSYSQLPSNSADPTATTLNHLPTTTQENNMTEKNTNGIVEGQSAAKAALLAARVSEGGDGGTLTGEPALILQNRVSTGSGSSDASCRSLKKKEESTAGQVNNNNNTSIMSIVNNKRRKSIEEIDVRPAKKDKLSGSTTATTTTTMPQPSSALARNLQQLNKQGHPIHTSTTCSASATRINGQGVCSSGGAAASASTPGHMAKAGARPKLAPLKLKSLINEIHVPLKTGGGYILEVNNNVEKCSWSYQISCSHQKSSLDGLTWTVVVDSAIAGVCGDASRIILCCENGLCHVLDLKGRYTSVPFALPSLPHKMVQTGQYLMIVSVKATVHVWNLATKKNVIRCESLLPILHDPGKGPLEITHCAILVGGIPFIVLSNGKSFKFNTDYQSWVLFVNVATSSYAADLTVKPDDDEFRLSSLSRRIDYPLLSQIKMKLTAAIDQKKSDEVQTWMILLGITLAKEGLESELRFLCVDLLGPYHSGSVFPSNPYHHPSNNTNNNNLNTSVGTNSSSGPVTGAGSVQNMWNPLVAGLSKRDILRQLLGELSKNLRWQSLFSEFNTQLQIAEGNSMESISSFL